MNAISQDANLEKEALLLTQTGDGFMSLVATKTALQVPNGTETIAQIPNLALKTAQLTESLYKTGPIPMELKKSPMELR
jgi:hypothetical protein